MVRSPAAGWLFAATLAPFVALIGAVLLNAGPADWLHLSRPLLQSLVPNALLYTTWMLVIGAPLAGVVRAAQPRMLAVAVALFVGGSASVHFGAFGFDIATLSFVATTHATMASAALALVALGALCATMFGDRLDAAAAATATVIVLSGGVLVAGAPVGEAPRAVIEAALTASPVVAISAAAGIDLARSDVLYQISPLARLHFDYPIWYVASAWYLAAAALLTLVSARSMRTIDAYPQLKGFSCPSCREF